MALELVSHPICPFVHRTSAFLTEHGVPFTQYHIDLQAKPDWFLAISPRGKVPVLVVDKTPIFESAVILEYAAEVYAPHVIPKDPLARARMRMWIEISNDLFLSHYKIASAATPAERSAAADAAHDTLSRFEPEIRGPYFDGETPGLVDFAAGPAFYRHQKLRTLIGLDVAAQLPKVSAWSRVVAARPSFASTLVDDFDARYDRFVRRHESAA